MELVLDNILAHLFKYSGALCILGLLMYRSARLYEHLKYLKRTDPEKYTLYVDRIMINCGLLGAFLALIFGVVFIAQFK